MTAMSYAVASGAPGADFIELLPRIRAALFRAFRSFRPEAREDAMQEALANCYAAFVRLWERGHRHLAAPVSLARYAVAQWFDGRRVGSSSNGHDILSAYGRRRHGLKPISDPDSTCPLTRVPDSRTPVPDQVAFRVDFPAWLATLGERQRAVALALAQGDPPSLVASQFGISRGRVSQLRTWLAESWSSFHGANDEG